MDYAHPILLLLLQIATILAASRLVGMVFARFGQPQVVGEMIAGIMLGPSLLGWVAPGTFQSLFPASGMPTLNALSQIGVTLFLFLIGLELDPKLLRNRGRAALVISHVSIVAPFLLGAGLALYLYTRVFHDTPTMNFTAVALFMGAAMSITAFPVLARILTERNLHKSKVGAISITCAAIDDVTAWCMLAFVIAIARARGIEPGLVTAGLSLAYVAVMFFGVRPFLHRLQLVFDRQGRLSQNVFAVILLLVVLSSVATEWIGIHALFGAFLMGAIMPKGTAFVRAILDKLEDVVVIFLLPIFFAYTGLKTQIGVLDTAELWIDCLVIIVVACLGKFGGSTLAARAAGLDWRESAAIGILMNTRGLMELVILNIGRELGVITDAVFAMMVIMALFTTALTTPVLAWVYPAKLMRRKLAGTDLAGDKPSDRAHPPYSILIPISLPKSGPALLQLAHLIGGGPDASSRLVALHLNRPTEHDAYRAGIDSDDPQHSGPLEPLLTQARKDHIQVSPISFTSNDFAGDIVAVAQERESNLILLGFHKPIIGTTILGGTVHKVISGAGIDAGVLVDRGFRASTLKQVLVPLVGASHDRLALQIAARIARSAGARVTILHVVAPRLPGDLPDALPPTHPSRADIERIYNDPTQPLPVTMRVVEDESPVEAVLAEAPRFDLVVIGVAEEFGLQSNLFGWKPERIARDSPTSLLIVREKQG